MLASSETDTPSSVTTGSWACRRASLRRVDSSTRAVSKRWRAVASGSMTTSPDRPSIAINPARPFRPSTPRASRSPATPTTAGIPYARARIAAWAVGDDPWSAIPSSRSRGRVAVTDGGRSSPTTIAGPSSSPPGVSGAPLARRAIRLPTSSTSAERAASSSSSSDRSWSAKVAAAAWTAATASSADSLMRVAASVESAGSRAMLAWARKIAASSGCPSRVTRSAIASSSWAAALAAARSRSTSAGASVDWIVPPAGAGAGEIRTHAPTATPGAAPRPGKVFNARRPDGTRQRQSDRRARRLPRPRPRRPR